MTDQTEPERGQVTPDQPGADQASADQPSADQADPDLDAELKDLVESILADARQDGPADVVDQVPTSTAEAGSDSLDAAELLAERTLDLQRLQAEYANYKKRVDRDRDQARLRGIEAVVIDLLPVLDGIEAAETHGDLTGGTKMLADELAKVAAKYGLVGFGAEGEPFDPHVHEALMHLRKPGYDVTSVAAVFQRGYRLGDRLIRPARVGVADPEPVEPEPEAPQ